MLHASQGRNGLLRGFVRHNGHNGPGSGTTTRSVGLSSNVRGLSRMVRPITPTTLEATRSSHRLFPITKNLLQRLFNHLAAPGLSAPTYSNQSLQTSTRSLNNSAFCGNSIQNGLSLPVRASLKNNALHRQATMFLPCAPNSPPPRCGGVTQVGLGTARNFTTGRPIFQQLAENVPIAARALYEADWDFEMRKEHARAHMGAEKQPKPTQKELLKRTQRGDTHATRTRNADDAVTPSRPDFDHYFSSKTDVTTFLYVPLAPRMPLPQHPVRDESTLLPFPDLAALHGSYATHNLRVQTLFTRLEQADVWSRGVSCCSYSQGLHNWIYELNGEGAGVCTNLKLVFEGWTKAEVKCVIGESGTGWCAFEESWHDQVSEALSEASLSSDSSISRADSPEGLAFIDPSESFVMPKLAFSSSFLASGSQLSLSSEGSSCSAGLSNFELNGPSSSGSSSYSELAV